MVNRKTKDSKIGWIGEVPHNWKIVRVKLLFEIGRGRVIAKTELKDDGKYPVYSSQTKDNGILGYINSYDYEQDQLTWTTDGANAGTVFLRRGKYNCTNVCGTLRPMKKEINLNYMLYALEHIAHYHKRADTNGFKIMSNEMAAIKITFPPLSEQQKIADFLDEKVAHIDNILEDTKKSIEYLKAYKQSLITETVTKGLNANVEMKNSGIEWIGEIPKHWESLRIKYASYLKGRIGWQGLTSEEYQDEGPYLITGKDLINGKVNWSTCTHITKERFDEAPDIHIENQDLLITKDGTIGKVALVSEFDDKASLNSGVLLIRKTKDCYNEKFLYYILISDVFWRWFNLIKSPNSTILHLYQNDFKDFSYPLPHISEQQQIADYLDEKTAHLDSLLRNKEKMLEELKAYKKSLIYEYVTGKKEVQ